MKRVKAYGIGRTRDKTGKITDTHLRPYTMCIHTRVGSEYKTMQVLVAEYYDKTSDEMNTQPKTQRPAGKGWCWDPEVGKWYRVRRLTPRECFRLQGVREHEIDIIQSTGVSRTQQYKMAGNSIPVNCMVGLFENLFFPE